ncbi:unnamed protein product [Peniophora sp. CBMAI 1063]|nr:unnamed protein product [Peniophora sp. CBMAI 1063]
MLSGSCRALGLRTCRRQLLHRLYSSNAVAEQKPFYVTTPIFYPNAAPHIGHLYTLVTADIIARHARLTKPDRPVYFLTGTDEHGLKIQNAARQRGLEPRALCDQLSATFREMADSANISYSRFIRTTDEDHYAAVKHLWQALAAKGLIRKAVYTGYYSVTDECFYTRDQVQEQPDGTFTSLETGSLVELSEEENYMFSLSHLGSALSELYRAKAGGSTIIPAEKQDAVLGEVEAGLEELSISRPVERLQWGIPVPDDPGHTIYVWIDALTNYLTATGYPWQGAERGVWPPDVQVIGKDIVRFHAIYLPAMLLALNIPTAKSLLVHGHWTVSRRKMSKSVGNVVDPFTIMSARGVDVVRFYLARVGGSYGADHDWSEEQLDKHAKELRTSIGNLFSRTHSDAVMSRLPDYLERRAAVLESMSNDTDVDGELRTLASDVDGHLSRLEIKLALEKVVAQLGKVNALLESTAPWSASTPDSVRARTIALSSETLRIAGIVLQPFMPTKANELLDALGVPAQERAWANAGWRKGSVGMWKKVALFPVEKDGKGKRRTSR